MEVLDAQCTTNEVYQNYYETLYNANASLVELCRAVADNFYHATIFQEGDPLLDLVLQGYEQTGMKGTTGRFGTPAKALNHELVKSFPESRVAMSKGPSTCEWFCTVFYELLKDKLNIKKVEFRSSSLKCASKEF